VAESTVVVENFAGWRKSIKDLDTGLDKELKQGLRTIGVKVTTRAKEWARAQGLVASGDLVRKIAPSVTQKGVAIVAKAKRGTFAYPAVYEYGGRGNLAAGPRAFLTPAVKASEALIRDELGKVIDEVSRKAGFH